MTRSVDMFLARGLNKILNDKECKKSSNTQLKKACEVALDELKKDSQLVIDSQNAEKYLLPFELACKTKISRIVETSLDCLQKLIAHGYLTNTSDASESEFKQELANRVTKSICACFEGPQIEDNVQLQIIKCLLTILTSPHLEVHDQCMLLPIKTCYNIHISSRSLVNQKSATAALTQIINTVLQRYEQSVLNQIIQQQEQQPTQENVPKQEEQSKLFHQYIEYVQQAIGNDEYNHEYDDIAYLMFNMMDLVSEEKVLVESHSSQTQIAPSQSDTSKDRELALIVNPFERDVFLMFRAFCLLSQRQIIDCSSDTKNNIELRSKILSLQLILTTLQNARTAFKQNLNIISLIRKYLCVSLSKNGVSPINEVFEFSLAIFVALLADYKHYLKKQVEVFFREIIIYLLDTQTSSFEQKWLVIQTLTRICADAQCVVDLYVNYDCDLQSTNIFALLVEILSKLAQGRQAIDLGCSLVQVKNLRLKGLECLVSILKCMVEWSKDLYVNANQAQSHLGPENQPNVLIGDGDELSGKMKSYDSENSLNSQDFEIIKQKKEIWEKGIELFNKKPNKGLQYLKDQQLLGGSPDEIAEFFLNDERLNKTAIGDYLGENEKFNKEVMYAYVDLMSFYNIEIVAALRLFLQGFRLPGEAQKIDRLMEKFAHRYHECNKRLANQTDKPPNTINYYFESADAVYVCAFSIIMLATDLHSSSVKRKMTKDDYVKMNRGINDSKDLPREYLELIFDLVAESEIKLKSTGNTSKPKNRSENVSNEKQRRLLYNMEIEQVTQTARLLMESMYHVQTNFTSATYGQHVKPMFKLAWTSFLAAFSIGIQDSCDEQKLTDLCLTGIRCAIRISGIFHLELERDAFVQALARFTSLATTGSLSDFKSKNVECIKTLITIAHTDGNYLGASWLDILKCISQLELAQLLGSATLANAQIGETGSQSVIVAVDRIFSGSVRLNGDAINEFVRALCLVSTDELHSNPPRMYSLQKIVEISYYNMGRIRLQWTRIWSIVGEHFNRAGCNQNEEIAFFSVDSLRQLAMKFLEKGEFASFRFQKDFLKSFEVIMKKNSSYTIRDMCVQCIAQMVKSQAHNLKSGWKNIFSVFHQAASSNDDRIVSLSFETMNEIVRQLADRYFLSILDSFTDAIKCLSEFACNPTQPDISIEAIGLIRHCAVFVSDRPRVFAENSGEDLKNVPEEDRVWVKGWFPILFELSCIINRCKLDVRTRGLTVMFEIMKTYGESFKQRWWKDVFNVVFRIFDNMKLPEAQVEKAEWMTTTCNHALYAIIDVFTQYFEIMRPILIDDLYTQLKWCIKQDNEQLARSGTNCLENFVISNGTKFDEQTWARTCDCLVEVFAYIQPQDLLTWKPDGTQNGCFYYTDQESIKSRRTNSVTSLNSTLSEDSSHTKSKIPHLKVPVDMEHRLFQSLLIKCVVQLELIQTIDNIVFYPTTSKKEDACLIAAAQYHEASDALSTPSKTMSHFYASNDKQTQEVADHGMYSYLSSDQLFTLIDCLYETYLFASKFNGNSEQRTLLWKAGFKGKDKPNLLKHEVQSLACILRILFKMYSDVNRENCQQKIQSKLYKICHDLLQYYLLVPSENHREAWDNIIILLITKILKLNQVKFKLFTSYLYSQICDLLTFSLKSEVRNLLHEFFIQIGKTHQIMASESDDKQ